MDITPDLLIKAAGTVLGVQFLGPLAKWSGQFVISYFESKNKQLEKRDDELAAKDSKLEGKFDSLAKEMRDAFSKVMEKLSEQVATLREHSVRLDRCEQDIAKLLSERHETRDALKALARRLPAEQPNQVKPVTASPQP